MTEDRPRGGVRVQQHQVGDGRRGRTRTPQLARILGRWTLPGRTRYCLWSYVRKGLRVQCIGDCRFIEPGFTPSRRGRRSGVKLIGDAYFFPFLAFLFFFFAMEPLPPAGRPHRVSPGIPPSRVGQRPVDLEVNSLLTIEST